MFVEASLEGFLRKVPFVLMIELERFYTMITFIKTSLLTNIIFKIFKVFWLSYFKNINSTTLNLSFGYPHNNRVSFASSLDNSDYISCKYFNFPIEANLIDILVPGKLSFHSFFFSSGRKTQTFLPNENTHSFYLFTC